MTAPTLIRHLPYHDVEESDDGRWYIIDGQRLMSVTTAFKAIEKMALVPWAAGLAANAAFDELPTIVAASRRKPCDRTYQRCRHDRIERCEQCPCGECRACVAKWLADRHITETVRRAHEGTRVHDVVEWWSLHGDIKAHDPDITPYVKAFQAFTAEYGLLPDDVLMSEAIVIHRDIAAAGQTDGIIRFRAERSQAAAKLISRVLQVPWRQAVKQRLTVDLIVDYKTREKPGPKFYPENALQLAGYRNFPVVRVKDTDHELPLPATDGGLIIQLRPDGATPRLVRCDKDTYERGFLHALHLYEWLVQDGSAAVSSRTFVLPETVAARARKANTPTPAPATQE